MEPADVSLSGFGVALSDPHRRLNGGYPYLEVKCLGCETHQTMALNIVRWPKIYKRPAQTHWDRLP
jgi:hypothetical protein